MVNKWQRALGIVKEIRSNQAKSKDELESRRADVIRFITECKERTAKIERQVKELRSKATHVKISSSEDFVRPKNKFKHLENLLQGMDRRESSKTLERLKLQRTVLRDMLNSYSK